jgi:hypothetical protein
MPTELTTTPVVARLARNAPSRMAGQRALPPMSKALSAIPVGGQTVVALGLR